MKIQPVKTAIVGCGAISDAYLNTMINKFKILDVVACCNRNPEKAQKMAQKLCDQGSRHGRNSSGQLH